MSITLTGTFTRLDGDPATGTVRVTPSRSPIMDPDGKIVISGPQTFPLDKDGKLTVQIPASNDPDLGPAFTYAIDVNLTHASWKISKVWIPHGSTTVDLSEIGDYQPVPGVATRVVTIPADGTDGQVLVWDGAGFSWEFPPEGPQGPKGDSDAEQLTGTPKIVNLALGREFETSSYNTYYKSSPLGVTEGDIIYTHRVYSNDEGPNHNVIGSIVIVASDAIHTYLAGAWRPSSSAKFVKSKRVEITSPVPENAYIAFYGETPAAPALFSDINIVNLTQVYGAGNEPSLEYMDALVEKHGGYIDGKQYVVGDAIHALTLAAQGLALRHDTTVGERVLLDHPGGTTMLHGDTGWRTLTSWDDTGNITGQALAANLSPTPGVPGWIRVRRENNTVTLAIRGMTIGPAAQGHLLPTGFGTGSLGMRIIAQLDSTSTAIVAMPAGSSAIYIAPATAAKTNDMAATIITWPTTTAWPTTQPGLPA